MEQRTIEWHRARLGKFTGSRVGDLMVKGRSKDQPFGGTAMGYIRAVAAQRLLNPAVVEDDGLLEDYIALTSATSKAMRWGTDNEGDARDLYHDITGNKVIEVASVGKAGMPYFAASPDGVVVDKASGEVGVLEIKCVMAERFVEFLAVTDGETLKAVEPRYYWQVMAEMSCTGYTYADFVTYNPYLRDPLHIVRIARDEEDVASMLERVRLAEEIANTLTA